MPRTNQGVFKELKNDYRELNTSISRLNDEYFDDEGNIEGDMIFYQDYFGDANSAYESALELENSLSSLLHDTKFEMESKEKEYKDMLDDVSVMKNSLKQKFTEQLNKYTAGIDGLDQFETDMLNGLQIYRDMD